MHAALFVCLPRSKARSSWDARYEVREYLTQEGFDTERRFSGRCDYFKVGGRWSGWLSLLRLKYNYPKQFATFWKRYNDTSSDEEDKRLFRKMFPKYRGKLPFGRDPLGLIDGYPDDAQIMNEPLFQQLKVGFSEEVRVSDNLFKDPCVIFTNDPDDDFEWPKTNQDAAKFWVVLIDYHF